MDYRELAAQIAVEEGIPPDLFLRLVQQESAFNPNAVSPVGARGLAQLMPGTAADLGVDPDDPVQNLRGGARYLRQQLDTFGEVDLALAAYNAGPGNVRKYGGIPPFKETQNYVRKITGGGGPAPDIPRPQVRPPAQGIPDRPAVGGPAPAQGIPDRPAVGGPAPVQSSVAQGYEPPPPMSPVFGAVNALEAYDPFEIARRFRLQ